MDKYIRHNDMGILEVYDAPDTPNRALTIAQSIELFRRHIRSMNLMSENSSANIALQYVAKLLAIPQMQAKHWEALAKLIETSEVSDDNDALKGLVETMLGREVIRVEKPVEEEPPVEEEKTPEPEVEKEPEPTPEPEVVEQLEVPEPVVESTPEPVEEIAPPEPVVDPVVEPATEPEDTIEVTQDPVDPQE